ncbi:integrase core domain-containing protein [Undibacterium sp. SXout7W]|uniref:integrase core domain-containing protein n=1 Tax=Undibacterium sp. SXout7W TaxID=3413049 RepID=UPI003BF1791D
MLDARAYEKDLKFHFIELGKLQQNACIERFNGKFRNECLNERWFISMWYAKVIVGEWHQDYNEQ